MVTCVTLERPAGGAPGPAALDSRIPPPRRPIVPGSGSQKLILLVAVAVAAVCARLGFWQVDRLGERRSHNALLLSRLSVQAVPAIALPRDTGAGHYLPMTAAGTLDYSREIAWAPRMRRASPGVNLLTPLKLAGSDTVVMVNRGWVYSPDARSVEFSRWRESDSATIAGYAETWSVDCGATDGAPLPPLCGDSASRALRRLDRRVAERLVGAPVAPYVLMQTSDSALRADSVPARVDLPVLDEGPHFGYAIQWFAFAAIALVGGSLLARTRRIR